MRASRQPPRMELFKAQPSAAREMRARMGRSSQMEQSSQIRKVDAAWSCHLARSVLYCAPCLLESLRRKPIMRHECSSPNEMVVMQSE